VQIHGTEAILMGQRVKDEAEWDDEGWEANESTDESDEDHEQPIPCPYCRREIHEDSPRCPHCGQYISEEDAPPARKPWWIILGAVLCLYILWRWIMG
jgi:hypothetical protein